MGFSVNTKTKRNCFSPLVNARLFCLFAAGLLCAAGCKQDATSSPPPAPSAVTPKSASTTLAATPAQGTPQPKLPALKLWIGTNAVMAELAMTFNQVQTGMMWRTNMAEMEGMLFVFGEPHQVSFYMKNTLLPLSCAYVDGEGTILEIYDMKPLDETPIPSKSDQVMYVLEMNQGWFQRHGIKPGVVIATDRGTMQQTFQRR